MGFLWGSVGGIWTQLISSGSGSSGAVETLHTCDYFKLIVAFLCEMLFILIIGFMKQLIHRFQVRNDEFNLRILRKCQILSSAEVILHLTASTSKAATCD